MEQVESFKRKVGERGQVTIPIEIREEYGLTSGEVVKFSVSQEGEIVLRKADDEEELASAYRRTAERDRQVNSEWEHVSVEATDSVEIAVERGSQLESPDTDERKNNEGSKPDRSPSRPNSEEVECPECGSSSLIKRDKNVFVCDDCGQTLIPEIVGWKPRDLTRDPESGE